MNSGVRGIEFETAGDAIEHAREGRKAIQIGGKYLVVDETDADRLAAAGVEFAYVFAHKMPDGSHRIMTIPVND